MSSNYCLVFILQIKVLHLNHVILLKKKLINILYIFPPGEKKYHLLTMVTWIKVKWKPYSILKIDVCSYSENICHK